MRNDPKNDSMTDWQNRHRQEHLACEVFFRTSPLSHQCSQTSLVARFRGAAIWCFAMLVVGLLTSDASAEDWMFERSYFSHAIPPHLAEQYPRPESRSAYRPAYIGNQPGFAARGAYRYRIMQMTSGRSTDTTIFREQWLNSRMFP